MQAQDSLHLLPSKQNMGGFPMSASLSLEGHEAHDSHAKMGSLLLQPVSGLLGWGGSRCIPTCGGLWVDHSSGGQVMRVQSLARPPGAVGVAHPHQDAQRLHVQCVTLEPRYAHRLPAAYLYQDPGNHTGL